jgi:UDP-N-acetyl-D-mannosaminuronate dehydrogenase
MGLPLVLRFARQGFQVLGFDADEGKVEALNTG